MKWLDMADDVQGPNADDLRNLAAGNPAKVSRCDLVLAEKRSLYKNLSLADLQALRRCLYQGQPQDAQDAGPWIEATLRFCEVCFSRLKRRMGEIWGRDMAPAMTVLTAALLLEVHLASGDLRFLNTVEKLRTSRLFPSRKDCESPKNRTVALAKAICEISDSMVDKCRKL